MNPFFSVIIPLYNKEEHILDTLNSVLNQTFTDFEIIIINDGGTDQSSTLVSNVHDPRIRLIYQKNQGVSVARNNGITTSIGDYIALLDADDIWLPHHLTSLHQLIHEFPKAGLYCTRYAIKYHENYTKEIVFSRPVATGMSIIEDYFAASMINPIAWTSAVAFSKSSFNQIGKFDAKLFIGEDIDLFIRFVLKLPIVFFNEVTMIYNKDTVDSLSTAKLNDQIDYFINKYRNEEIQNPSLKFYLDLNRFALAIRSRIAGQKNIWNKQLNEIAPKNLTFKQRALLQLPSIILRLLAKIHSWLIQNRIYLRPLN